jgi:hypothetical protein
MNLHYFTSYYVILQYINIILNAFTSILYKYDKLYLIIYNLKNYNI